MSLAMTQCRRRMTALFLLGTASALAVATVNFAPPGVAASAPGVTTYIAPAGSGTICSQAAPCADVSTAVAVTPAGGSIVAEAGVYAYLKLSPLNAHQTPKALTVEGAPGGTAIFQGMGLARPDMTFRSVSFDGSVYLHPSADHVTLDDVHVYGMKATVLARTSYITITNSLIEGGIAHDGIQIASHPANHDILVQDTVIRDFSTNHIAGSEHPDCIQMFDTYNVTINRVRAYDCYNTGMETSTGAGLGLSNVTVESSFFSGCMSSRQHCHPGGASLDLRQTTTHTSIINDTFGAGSLRMPYQPGVYAARDIVGYLSVANPCTTSLTDSMIGGYPAWACKTAPGVSQGNFVGKATFVDPANGDLHLAATQQQIILPSKAMRAPTGAPVDATDFDGRPLAADTIGADQRGSSPSLTNQANFTTTFTQARPGDTFTPAATTVSGAPATISVVDPAQAACTMAPDGTVTYTAVGTCELQATPIGSTDPREDSNQITWVRAAAAAAPGTTPNPPTTSTPPSTTQSTITTPTVKVSVRRSPVSVGAVTLSAAVSPADVAGAVQFQLDGGDVGPAVALSSGSASESLDVPVGSYTVTAVFRPTDKASYRSAGGTTSLAVAKATSALAITIGPRALSATVAAPAGVPATGAVTFSVAGTDVGTARLHSDIAIIPYALPSGSTEPVFATYSGSAQLARSIAQARRRIPSVRTTMSSQTAQTDGWFRSPVTVSFVCASRGARLAAECPSPVTLRGNGRAHLVSRRVAQVNGAATVAVAHVNIDRQKPVVRVARVHDRATYRSMPHPRCVGSDAVSGIARCVVRVVKDHGRFDYVAVATDRAGNTSRAAGWFRVSKTGRSSQPTRRAL